MSNVIDSSPDEDSSLELPTEITLQVGADLRVGAGRLRLRFLSKDKTLELSLAVDGSSTSVTLDERLHDLLARWLSDPTRAPAWGAPKEVH